MTDPIRNIKLNNSIPKDAYVLLIGAMKCGTTALFHYLKEHPQICPSVVKEPEFFSRGPQGKNIIEPEIANIKFYEELWAFDPSRHRYVLEASTGYTKIPINMGVPKRMYDAGMQPKFIYIVRNPYDRIESQFNHNLRKGQENRRLNDEKFVYFSNYYRQLKEYTEKFPKESILVLSYDLLNKNPAECLRSVYKFLDLSDHYIPAEFDRRNVMNETGLGAKLFKNRIIKRLFKKKRGKIIQFLDKLFPPPDRPRLTEEERKQIYNALYEDMQKLQSEFGVDVKQWGF